MLPLYEAKIIYHLIIDWRLTSAWRKPGRQRAAASAPSCERRCDPGFHGTSQGFAKVGVTVSD